MMLTKEQIEEIKQKHKEGMIPKDIAQEYGVTRSCIYKHLRNKDNKIDIDSLIPVKVVSSDVLTFKMDNHIIELKKDELKAFLEAMM